MEKLEKLIGVIYREWKARKGIDWSEHPDEEAFIAFINGRMSSSDNTGFQTHLVSCHRCADILAADLRMQSGEDKAVPGDLLEKLKVQLLSKFGKEVLDILLRAQDKVLELLRTNGDVLVGQELVPAAVLRSRQIKDFRDEVNILKNLGNLLIEVKIINKQNGVFGLHITVKEKQTQKEVKDLRLSLLKDDRELESFYTDSGKVSFEHLLLGRYKVEISGNSGKLAGIALEIKG